MPPVRPVDRGHRVGVIDIGSNSIRLVVFEGDRRMPIPIFNEKVLCRLGAALGETGRLSDAGRSLAMTNLARFMELADEMALSGLDIVATAAVRDASNGPAFVRDLTERFGHPVRVLSGEEEARLSAQGVISAFPGADGVVGDLGGGSLELVDVSGGETRRAVSLPVGPLRLMELAEGSRRARLRRVDRHLDAVDWMAQLEGRALYAVGGVWRSLARAHMEAVGYPLQVIQNYVMPHREAMAFSERIAQFGSAPMQAVPGVARRRLETMPLGALLLARLLQAGRPRQVVFSAFGLREGVLFDRLSEADRRQDPLLASCIELAAKSGRFPPIAEAAEQWVKGVLPHLSPREAHMLRVIAVLSDLAWSEHPRYRGEHAFFKVLRLPAVGMTHPERAFVASAIFARYSGLAEAPDSALVRDLLDEEGRRTALLIGLTMRLALTLSGGLAGLLARTEVRRHADRFAIVHPVDLESVNGDVVQRRAEELASALRLPVIFERAPGSEARTGEQAIA